MTKFSRLKLMTTALFAVSIVACTTTERDLVTSYVWSDDDSRHTWVRSQYTVEMGVLPDGRERETQKDAKFRVYTRDANGSNQSVYSDWKQGVVHWVFDMKTSGYMMARVDKGTYGDSQSMVRISSNGTMTEFDSFERNPYCGTYFAAPSPDGSLIAILTQSAPAGQEPQSLSDMCPDNLDTDIRVVDSTTLADVDHFTFQAGKTNSLRWTTQNTFMYERNGWMSWISAGNTVASSGPQCEQPVTSSSVVAADGRRLENGDDVESQPIRLASWTSQGFGCQ